MPEAVTDRDVTRVLTHWHIPPGGPVSWTPLHDKKTVFLIERGGEPPLVLKLVGDDPVAERLESEYEVLTHLDRSGVPVSVPLLAEDGRPYTQEHNRVYTLSPALPNESSGLSSGQEVSNIGRALGRLHRALADYPRPILSWHYDLPTRVFEEAVPRILERLIAPDAADLDSMTQALRPGTTQALLGLPEQHVHGDAHSGNILRHNGQVSGFIDLDHLPSGPRIYDLSYLMADMMKSRIYDPRALTECFGLFGALIVGYEDEALLSAHEKLALWHGMLAVQLMFTETFLNSGDVGQAHRNLTAFYCMCWQKEQITRSIEGAVLARESVSFEQ